MWRLRLRAPRSANPHSKGEAMEAFKPIEFEKVHELVREAGGELVSWDVGDETCPVFRFKPQPAKFALAIEKLAGLGIRLDVFPYGIPKIDELLVRARLGREARVAAR